MIDPPPQTPDGRVDHNDPNHVSPNETGTDQGLLDRSQQAARFLDLARQHAFEPEEPLQLNPLIAARLHDADDFGDGNGFAADMPFGVDDTPLDPFD